MNPESIDLLVSGLMGMIGGLITIPVNAFFSMRMKREELELQHRLDLIAKSRELLLDHQLQLERMTKESEMAELRAAIEQLKSRFE
jgi:hypothetical protein